MLYTEFPQILLDTYEYNILLFYDSNIQMSYSKLDNRFKLSVFE